MISVDNFYEIFKSHYGWQKHRVLTWAFEDHGSKCFSNLISLNHWQETPLENDFTDERLERFLGGCLIHHDQEIFLVSSLDTYRQHRFEQKKINFWMEHISNKDLILQRMRTLSWPIFCHSEVGSKDIDWIEQAGLIPCYYFWHGLIARDWFRHWKHHADLISNRTQWDKRFLLYARDTTGFRQYRKTLLSKLRELKTDILHDWNKTENISSDHSAKISVEDAVKSAIHIVAETVFDLDRIHATEKVFKPMVMKQPFIIFAGPGMLEYLKSYGFMTFGHLWDESYDQEFDHVARMEKLVSLIKDINSLNSDDFRKLMINCQQVIDHNHKHFFSDAFESHLMSELHSNVKSALTLQKNKEKTDPGGSYFDFFYRHCMKPNGLYPSIDLERKTMSRILKMIKIQDPERLDKIFCLYPWAKQFYQ